VVVKFAWREEREGETANNFVLTDLPNLAEIKGDKMGSLRMVYDHEGDILDVDFRLTGEKPRQGIELHDNITVWTNAQGAAA
jgi:hypothetical protein